MIKLPTVSLNEKPGESIEFYHDTELYSIIIDNISPDTELGFAKTMSEQIEQHIEGKHWICLLIGHQQQHKDLTRIIAEFNYTKITIYGCEKRTAPGFEGYFDYYVLIYYDAWVDDSEVTKWYKEYCISQYPEHRQKELRARV